MLWSIWAIYQLPYPYTDASKVKDRPVVIVIEESDDYEVMYITTKPVDDGVILDKWDFIDGWLNHISYVSIRKSIPYDKSLFTADNYLWHISNAKIQEILTKIMSRYKKALEMYI